MSLASANTVFADPLQSTERYSRREVWSALGSIIRVEVNIHRLRRREHPFFLMFCLILPVLQCIDLFRDPYAPFKLVQKVMLDVHLGDIRDF